MTRIVVAAAPTIAAPHIEWSLLSPMLLVFAAALVGVLFEAFAPRDLRRPMHIALTLGSLAGAFVLTVVLAAQSSDLCRRQGRQRGRRRDRRRRPADAVHPGDDPDPGFRQRAADRGVLAAR